MRKKVALLPGDGIGTEVMTAAVKLMHHVAEKYALTIQTTESLIGGCSYDAYGTPLTDETIQLCFDANAVLLGAVGGYKWENLEHHLKPEAALLKIRKSLGLYTNIRPAKVYPSFVNSSSLKENIILGTDFVVFRELTGGIYFGEPRGYDDTKGFNTMVYEKYEIERIAHQAFKVAQKRKKTLTSVDKANVLEVSQFWRKVVEEVGKEYTDVKVNNMYVDNTAMQIVRNPRQFDVILTSNLFGDIISDIAGMVTGSLGMLPSASLGDKYALYEPVHGSAPDIAGENKANPIAMISSVAMMFDLSFGLKEAANLIEKAIERTLAQGFRTLDINLDNGNVVSTDKMAEMITKNFDIIYKENKESVFKL